MENTNIILLSFLVAVLTISFIQYSDAASDDPNVINFCDRIAPFYKSDKSATIEKYENHPFLKLCSFHSGEYKAAADEAETAADRAYKAAVADRAAADKKAEFLEKWNDIKYWEQRRQDIANAADRTAADEVGEDKSLRHTTLAADIFGSPFSNSRTHGSWGDDCGEDNHFGCNVSEKFVDSFKSEGSTVTKRTGSTPDSGASMSIEEISAVMTRNNLTGADRGNEALTKNTVINDDKHRNHNYIPLNNDYKPNTPSNNWKDQYPSQHPVNNPANSIRNHPTFDWGMFTNPFFR